MLVNYKLLYYYNNIQTNKTVGKQTLIYQPWWLNHVKHIKLPPFINLSEITVNIIKILRTISETFAHSLENL